eukprot:scaffold2.g7482.t1
MPNSRYFPNRLGDAAVAAAAVTKKVHLESLRAALDYCLQRPGSKPSVYTGAAGVAYACWHVHRHAGAVAAVLPPAELLASGVELARAARAAVEQRPRRDAGWSLLAGHAGVFATAALCLHAAARAEEVAGRVQHGGLLRSEMEECVREYRDLAALALRADEDEFLYGRTGWLFGAAMLNRHVHPDAVPAEAVQSVVEKVLSSGRALVGTLREPAAFPTPLFFAWPPGPDASPYLGAAHGLMGILYTLLHFPSLLHALPGAQRDVEAALAYVLTLECDAEGRRGPHGHYPTQARLPHPRARCSCPLSAAAVLLHVTAMGPWRDREPLAHWCHGTTGAVFLLCKAHEVLGAPEHLAAALRSGEAVWERGLLRKGPGACHGVSDEFRRGVRTPDHPHSLFEGWGGAACLWADLLEPERAAFPWFELDWAPEELDAAIARGNDCAAHFGKHVAGFRRDDVGLLERFRLAMGLLQTLHTLASSSTVHRGPQAPFAEPAAGAPAARAPGGAGTSRRGRKRPLEIATASRITRSRTHGAQPAHRPAEAPGSELDLPSSTGLFSEGHSTAAPCPIAAAVHKAQPGAAKDAEALALIAGSEQGASPEETEMHMGSLRPHDGARLFLSLFGMWREWRKVLETLGTPFKAFNFQLAQLAGLGKQQALAALLLPPGDAVGAEDCVDAQLSPLGVVPGGQAGLRQLLVAAGLGRYRCDITQGVLANALEVVPAPAEHSTEGIPTLAELEQQGGELRLRYR